MNTPPKRPSRKLLAYPILILIGAFIFSSYITPKKNKEYSGYKKLLMGTVVEILIMEGDKAQFDGAAEAAFSEIKGLEKVFSSYKPDSEVSRISRRAGGAPIKTTEDVIYVVQKALQVSRLTGGAFDPTVGALAGVWGFSGEKKRVPAKKDVQKRLPLVDFRKVVVNKDKMTVKIEDKGMTLNLGGVAKGFIVKRAAEALSVKGVSRAIIKAGGDMFLFDNRNMARKASFVIGIKDPRNEGEILGEVYSKGGAVTTSGDYERFFIKDGKRYHHILDPSTGWPAMKSRSVTVMAEDPTIADALSTAIFVLGPKKGLEVIESLKGVEGVIVGADGFIHTSSGFKGRLFQGIDMEKQTRRIP